MLLLGAWNCWVSSTGVPCSPVTFITTVFVVDSKSAVGMSSVYSICPTEKQYILFLAPKKSVLLTLYRYRRPVVQYILYARDYHWTSTCNL